MRHNEFSGFPRLVDDLDALHEEINQALKRTYLAVGAVLLPCAGLVAYALGMAG